LIGVLFAGFVGIVVAIVIVAIISMLKSLAEVVVDIGKAIGFCLCWDGENNE
jgi:hypothetical protein